MRQWRELINNTKVSPVLLDPLGYHMVMVGMVRTQRANRDGFWRSPLLLPCTSTPELDPKFTDLTLRGQGPDPAGKASIPACRSTE